LNRLHFRFNVLLATISVALVCFGCQQKTNLMTVKAARNVQPAGIFADNMVLQRDIPVPVWGIAEPGKRVTVKFGDSINHTVSDSSGKWMVKLPPVPANSTPAELNISGVETITLKNILVGDVWLGSGQSNMYLPLRSCDGAQKAIAASANPSIRLFTCGRKSAVNPVPDRSGAWKICEPKSVGGFSGILYFFGKKIQKDINVPVGLIHSSVGGTNIERWISRRGYKSDPAYDELINMSDLARGDYKVVYGMYQDKIRLWLEKNIGSYGSRRGEEKGWPKEQFDDSSWKKIALPNAWEKYHIWIDGSVWFRKTIEIPVGWVAKDLTLSLGRIDDYDNTFCNGAKVGTTSVESINPWTIKRVYKVPAKIVKSTQVVIAVQVFDIHGLGGITGREKDFYLSFQDAKLSLKGEWRYKIESTHDLKKCSSVPEPPPSALRGLSSLYNGMINPLVPFGIRGVLWYQGESNAGAPYAYRRLMKTLIRDWRNLWNQGNFPFLIVQLASYQKHQPNNPLPKPVTMPEPGNSNWAELREAQSMALSEPKTGLAVTIDIGDRSDIHPRNKSEAGRRLALIAENMTYGKDIVFSGPLYSRMKIEGDQIRLSFKYIPGGLIAKGGPLKWFAIAGNNKKFVWADAKIDGNTVVVSSKKVKNPVAVRYAWAINPEGCNLYNKSGLPASPFRTDKWNNRK